MNKKTDEQRKSENFSLRLTRSERRDLESLARRLGRNKAGAMKYALGIAIQSLPKSQPRPQAAA